MTANPGSVEEVKSMKSLVISQIYRSADRMGLSRDSEQVREAVEVACAAIEDGRAEDIALEAASRVLCRVAA